MDKAHIKHAVSLIEDKYFDISEPHMSLRNEIEESTRSRDEDIDSFSHTRDLLPLTNTTKYYGRTEFCMATIGIKTFLNLTREFASRSEDETSSTPFEDKWFFSIFGDASGWSFCLFFESFRKALDDRESKGCRLPSSRLSTTEEVKSSEYDRDRFFLDGSRSRIPLFFEGFQNRGRELEFGK